MGGRRQGERGESETENFYYEGGMAYDNGTENLYNGNGKARRNRDFLIVRAAKTPKQDFYGVWTNHLSDTLRD